MRRLLTKKLYINKDIQITALNGLIVLLSVFILNAYIARTQGMEILGKFLFLKRSVEIQNTLFTFLTQQYEEAKIQEAKDNPTLQVLDKAIPPERKFKPRRARIVIIAFTLSFIASLYYVYFNEKWHFYKNKEISS